MWFFNSLKAGKLYRIQCKNTINIPFFNIDTNIIVDLRSFLKNDDIVMFLSYIHTKNGKYCKILHKGGIKYIQKGICELKKL